jgi:hypothetical protein
MKLAEAIKTLPGSVHAQSGWVPINELLQTLPWTTSSVTNSNVHKLVYKTRSLLVEHGIDRLLLEENQNGCYRLNIPPEKIKIEKFKSALQYGEYDMQYRK